MKKKKYIAPEADYEIMLLESMMDVNSVRGTAKVGMGFGDPGASGDQSAASRGSFWDDTE